METKRASFSGVTSSTYPVGAANSAAQEGYYDVKLKNTVGEAVVDRRDRSACGKACDVGEGSESANRTDWASAVNWSGFVASAGDAPLTTSGGKARRSFQALPERPGKSRVLLLQMPEPTPLRRRMGSVQFESRGGYSSVLAPVVISQGPASGVFNPGNPRRLVRRELAEICSTSGCGAKPRFREQRVRRTLFH